MTRKPKNSARPKPRSAANTNLVSGGIRLTNLATNRCSIRLVESLIWRYATTRHSSGIARPKTTRLAVKHIRFPRRPVQSRATVTYLPTVNRLTTQGTQVLANLSGLTRKLLINRHNLFNRCLCLTAPGTSRTIWLKTVVWESIWPNTAKPKLTFWVFLRPGKMCSTSPRINRGENFIFSPPFGEASQFNSRVFPLSEAKVG